MEQLEQDQLDAAERSFSKGLEVCRTEEDRQEMLRCLLKLAGKHIRRGVSDKPKTLHDYLCQLDLFERTRAMEWLARQLHQTDNIDEAANIYAEIFELRAKVLGSEHPDTVGALKTAALILQMQGKSVERLYLRAYQLSRETPSGYISEQKNYERNQSAIASSSEQAESEANSEIEKNSGEPNAALALKAEAEQEKAAQEEEEEVQQAPEEAEEPEAEAAAAPVEAPVLQQEADLKAKPQAETEVSQTKAKPEAETKVSQSEAEAAELTPCEEFGGTAKESSIHQDIELEKENLNDNNSKPDPDSPTTDSEATEKRIAARRKAKKKSNTLFLLDALLTPENYPAAKSQDYDPSAEAPGTLLQQIALESSLQELIAYWEPFCNQITQKLVKLLKQNSNAGSRATLGSLSRFLSEAKGLKPVDLEHPFLASARRMECRYLDWNILKDLAPVYAAYDGTAQTYPLEISSIYACLRRAFQLGPLHVDTLQSLYRLAHIYAQEIFGCYDIEFAEMSFRICLLAFKDHPEIDELTRIRCRTNLAMVLMAKGDFSTAKETLKEAVKMADSNDAVSRAEFVAILRSLAECTNQMGDLSTALSVYERLRNFQEAVARDIDLFDTFINLIAIHKKLANETQAQSYERRLVWEIDWVEDPNSAREIIATKAFELKQFQLAESMLHDIVSHSAPYDPESRRASNALIRVYEATKRKHLADKLRKATGLET